MPPETFNYHSRKKDFNLSYTRPSGVTRFEMKYDFKSISKIIYNCASINMISCRAKFDHTIYEVIQENF